MNDQTFSLQPFPSKNSLPNVKIAGNIARHDNQLTITYALFGDLNQVIIPTHLEVPTRKQELWQDTCFEFFLGIKDTQEYWEFNLSPTEDWNIYHFDSYRQGIQEETAFTTLPFSVQNQPESLALALNIDLERIVSADQGIDIGISTVIKHKNGDLSYWALTHPGAEADFHLRKSFIIQL